MIPDFDVIYSTFSVSIDRQCRTWFFGSNFCHRRGRDFVFEVGESLCASYNIVDVCTEAYCRPNTYKPPSKITIFVLSIWKDRQEQTHSAAFHRDLHCLSVIQHL